MALIKYIQNLVVKLAAQLLLLWSLECTKAEAVVFYKALFFLINAERLYAALIPQLKGGFESSVLNGAKHFDP